MWKDHPEKVLAFTEEFAEKNPKTVKAILRAMLESSQHIDKLENRPHMAEVVSRPQYINTQKEVILGRMLGDYDYGDGRKEKDPNYMTFFVRNTNFPWKSHGVWWLSQFRRWGMVKEAPPTRVWSIRCFALRSSVRSPKKWGYRCQRRHEEGDVV